MRDGGVRKCMEAYLSIYRLLIHYLLSVMHVCSAIMDIGPGPGTKLTEPNISAGSLGRVALVSGPYPCGLNICVSRAINKQ